VRWNVINLYPQSVKFWYFNPFLIIFSQTTRPMVPSVADILLWVVTYIFYDFSSTYIMMEILHVRSVGYLILYKVDILFVDP